MILRHATPMRNLPDIDRQGLRPDMSRGTFQAVWLCSPKLTHWGILHVAQRHTCPAEAVGVLTVAVPRSWLKRHSPGKWYCDRVIPPDRIAGSPDWFAGVVVNIDGKRYVAAEGVPAKVNGESAGH